MNSKLLFVKPLAWLLVLTTVSLSLLVASAQTNVPDTARIVAIGAGIAETVYALKAEARLGATIEFILRKAVSVSA